MARVCFMFRFMRILACRIINSDPCYLLMLLRSLIALPRLATLAIQANLHLDVLRYV
jgi:hypothetical protein